ncbi:MAG TPA: NAD(P)/FAD-dependent oxidoreductase [candidate division Zixibacteria bacterium]|nr:NAD(P)/FAD-dependent oxidoreductase [candidate division Zixibacteria bacterium]
MVEGNSTSGPSIAVVGGGMTGIAAACELARHGACSVTLFEQAERLGGLSSSFTWRDVTWDRFYHVILSTDAPLLGFIDELGLTNQLFWRDTKVGFYGDGRLVSLSSSWDFLTFPFMSPWQKVRLGLGILRSARIKDPARLDKIYVREWLTQMFGRRVYERIWDPLLRSKLGAARERTSAAFIWATINRLYGARGESSTKREKMGHVRGGYETILTAAARALSRKRVNILCGAPVRTVRTQADRAGGLTLQAGDDTFTFDKVILTTPCPETVKITGADVTAPYWKALSDVEYLSIACVVLILNKSLSPYYVTNLIDETLPFTGVIEATNIVDPEYLGGRHLVYLPKYMPAEDEVNQWDDGKVINTFVTALKRMHPQLQDADILHTRLFRERFVQPVQEVNFLQRKTGFRSPMNGVYVVNTSMIYNSTLNNNAAVALGRDCAREALADLEL